MGRIFSQFTLEVYSQWARNLAQISKLVEAIVGQLEVLGYAVLSSFLRGDKISPTIVQASGTCVMVPA